MSNAITKIGCCGFGIARPKYFETFSVAEIQQSFYQPPKPDTVKRWRDEAPIDFEFTLKAWQLITHEASSPTYRRLKEPVRKAEETGRRFSRNRDCSPGVGHHFTDGPAAGRR